MLIEFLHMRQDTLKLGKNVTIDLSRVQNGRAFIGVKARGDMQVHYKERLEAVRRIQQEFAENGEELTAGDIYTKHPDLLATFTKLVRPDTVHRKSGKLAIPREEGETILIGDNIGVTVLEIRGKTVKIGLELPESISPKRGQFPPRHRNKTSEPRRQEAGTPPSTEPGLHR